MEVRYLGFDQQQGQRVYRFDVGGKGELRRQMVVTADLSLFQTQHVAIQDGPSLCAQKLVADLEMQLEGDHTLTIDDLRQHAQAHAAEVARKIEARQNGARRGKPKPTEQSQFRYGQE
jgi:hypothetical protein